MMIKTYPIKVGDINCFMVHDGCFINPVNKLVETFKQATPEAIAEIYSDETEVIANLNALYIDTGSTKILADVGFGVSSQPEVGHINPALESIGVSPEDIDIVFLTHLHPDHIMGLITSDGELAYANARYVMTKEEWDEWIPRWEASDEEWDKQQLALIKPLEDKISFVGDGEAVVEGVTAVMIVGHTMGQSGLLVESNGERLFHVADLMHYALQFQHVDWHLHVDSDGDLAVKSRRRILQQCADENLLMTICHTEFPAVGHVLQDGDGWKWQPLAI